MGPLEQTSALLVIPACAGILRYMCRQAQKHKVATPLLALDSGVRRNDEMKQSDRMTNLHG